MKKVLTLILALCMMLMCMAPAIGAEKQTFTDVPTTHWAYANIEKAVEMGLLYGMGDNKYAPEATLSAAQFITIIGRVFYNDDVVAATTSEDNWYSAYVRVAQQRGVLNGVSAVNSLTEAISRYDMAQLMYNASKNYGLKGSIADTSKIADYAGIPVGYKDAVVWNYGTGFLVGFDSVGNFVGSSEMTRAQAATILVRITDQIQKEKTGGGTSSPVQPGKGAVQPVPDVLPTSEDIAELVTNSSEYNYSVSDEGFPAPGEKNDIRHTGVSHLKGNEVEFVRYVMLGEETEAIAMCEVSPISSTPVYDTRRYYSIWTTENQTAVDGEIITVVFPEWTYQCLDGRVSKSIDVIDNKDGSFSFKVDFNSQGGMEYSTGISYGFADTENKVVGGVDFTFWVFKEKIT